jgi:hypothetical protein
MRPAGGAFIATTAELVSTTTDFDSRYQPGTADLPRFELVFDAFRGWLPFHDVRAYPRDIHHFHGRIREHCGQSQSAIGESHQCNLFLESS